MIEMLLLQFCIKGIFTLIRANGDLSYYLNNVRKVPERTFSNLTGGKIQPLFFNQCHKLTFI